MLENLQMDGPEETMRTLTICHPEGLEERLKKGKFKEGKNLNLKIVTATVLFHLWI